MRDRISTFTKLFVLILHNITVEPIIFLVYFGWVFGNTFQSPGIYRRICQIYYGDDAGVNCYEIQNITVETDVQQYSAEWSLFNVLVYLLPAIFADIILGAYGDRYGRKRNILFGLGGIFLTELGFLLTLSSVATPYWTTLIFGGASGFSGFISMIPVSCNAYLADVTVDPHLLTIRSGVFSAAQLLASVFGAFLAAALAKAISVTAAMSTELVFFVLAALYTMWRIPQKPGLMEIDRKATARSIRPIGAGEKKNKPKLQVLRQFFAELISLLYSGLDSYTKKREGFRRFYIFASAFALMVSFTTAVETRTSGIINAFVLRRVDTSSALGWSTQDLGLWNGCGYSLLLLGTLSGLLIFKHILKLRETTIILIGLISSCARTILIAVTTDDDWTMYVGNVVGLFSGLVQPAVVSFISQVVSPSETGRVFSLFGICSDVSLLLATIVYASIYRATVESSPSFVFYMMFAIQLVALLVMIFVHIQSIREGISKVVMVDKPTSVQKAISRIGEESPQLSIVSLQEQSKSKMGKRQFSIMERAEELAQRQTSALWESTEDLRNFNNVNRNSSVNFY